MSTDVFSIRCDALAEAKLAGFKGVEALGRLFEFDLFFTVPAGADVKSAIGARATLVADRDDGRGPMLWHGILAAVRLLHETAERALYRASLVPRLWLLSHHVRSHVHTRRKVDVFVADTLKDAGFSTSDHAFHTDAAAYPQEEFVCQYRESHLDFIHRWLEREGLYYYFEHPEGGTEKLVIVDDKAHHAPLFEPGRVRYFPAAGADSSAGEHLRELHADYRLLPASVLISDYNYANPSAPVAGERSVSAAGQGKIREYGYRVFTEGEAARLAAVKAQSIACRELTVTASGDAFGLRAGYTFEVEDIPAELPAEYLAVEVRHAGAIAATAPLVRRLTGLDSSETYRVDVVAIPAKVQFRAPQSTPWPRIYGFENGTVDGPAESQYAQIDDQGRYLIRFKFDTSDLPDGSTSTYLRMMQPHGGSTEGWHFPLRKGTEVMVSFQGGDPDRPVIAGVVPNALTPSNVTSRNHTQNVLRTGGNNVMVMDDQEGSQFIDMATPVQDTSLHMGHPVKVVFAGYDDKAFPEVDIHLDMSTAGNAGFWIGGAWWEEVGSNKNVYVRGPVTIGYQQTHKLEIGGKSEEYYNGGLVQVISNDGSQLVFSNWSHYVVARNHGHYGQWEVDVDHEWTVKAGAEVKIKSTGGALHLSSDAADITISTPTKITLVAPEIKASAQGWYKGHSGASLESYSSKIMVGGHKSDCVAALYTCGYGVKLETTGYSAGLFGRKGESAAVAKLTFGGLFLQAITDVANAGSSVSSAAVRSVTAGLHALK
jgi:type VI secretion system secreted protein VgrG